MAPGEVGVDVFEEIGGMLNGNYNLVMPEPVKNEVRKLSRGRGEEAKAARIALELVERQGVEIVETSRKDGDASIVEAARKFEKPVIATNDKNLRNQFRQRSIPTVYVRTGDHVEMEGDIR